MEPLFLLIFSILCSATAGQSSTPFASISHYFPTPPAETSEINQSFMLENSSFNNISLSDFNWLNEPQKWKLSNDILEVTTNEGGDFWQGTWYGFHVNTGHVYGVQIKDDFTLTACIEAEFSELYDQAGLMIYQNEKLWVKAGIEFNDGQPMIGSVYTNELSDWATGVDVAYTMIYQDEKHWVKAGIEYNDGQPMIGSVHTNELSDWATGVFTGNPKKFYLRLTKKDNVVCVKYSTDNVTWILLRLCPFVSDTVFVGPMTCTPKRAGLEVKFSGITISDPPEDILHSN